MIVSNQSKPSRRHNPRFLARESDGSARVRMRFLPEEAQLYEEAAGTTPVLDWMHETLRREAEAEVAEARRRRPKVQP